MYVQHIPLKNVNNSYMKIYTSSRKENWHMGQLEAWKISLMCMPSQANFHGSIQLGSPLLAGSFLGINYA